MVMWLFEKQAIRAKLLLIQQFWIDCLTCSIIDHFFSALTRHSTLCCALQKSRLKCASAYCYYFGWLGFHDDEYSSSFLKRCGHAKWQSVLIRHMTTTRKSNRGLIHVMTVNNCDESTKWSTKLRFQVCHWSPCKDQRNVPFYAVKINQVCCC